jgi:hypothetical protein
MDHWVNLSGWRARNNFINIGEEGRGKWVMLLLYKKYIFMFLLKKNKTPT